VGELVANGREPPLALGDAANSYHRAVAWTEQREIHQVRDVKGATSALPEDAEPERPRPTFEAHPDLAGTIKGSERRSRLC
jgi:hypothetical protein